MTVELTDGILIGQISKPHGIRGWSNIVSYTVPKSNVFQYPWQIYFQDNWQTISKIEHSEPGSKLYAKLPASDSRTMADNLAGIKIWMHRSNLPKLPKDDYYWDELIGMKVIDIHGETLGVVDYLFDTGSNDVIVIKGKSEHMVPYLDSVIQSINKKNNLITIDWDVSDTSESK